MKVVGIAAVAVVLALGFAVFAPAIVADESDQVVITRPGVVFHKADGKDIRGRSVAKSIDAALEAGYTPCRVCFGKEMGAINVSVPGLAGAGTGASFGIAGSAIPAPPSSTVTQPFGIRTRGRSQAAKSVEAQRDPYQELDTIIYHVEQGAFEDR